MLTYEDAYEIAQKYAEKAGSTLTCATEGKDAWYFANTFGNWMADIGWGDIAVDKRTGKTDLIVISVLMHRNKPEDREVLDMLLHKDPDIILRPDICEALDRGKFDQEGNWII